MGLEPVGAVAEVDLERDVELDGALHALTHQVPRGVQLGFGDLEDEFVVDLQEHLTITLLKKPNLKSGRLAGKTLIFFALAGKEEIILKKEDTL